MKQVLRGPVSTDVPASLLQRHPHCEVLLDADAASCLPLDEKKSEGDKPSYLAPFLTMVFLFLIIGFFCMLEWGQDKPRPPTCRQSRAINLRPILYHR